MYTATIECTANIENLYKELVPEAAKKERFEISIKKTKDRLNISLTALDATALKAIMLSIIKLIETAEKINHGKNKAGSGTIANTSA